MKVNVQKTDITNLWNEVADLEILIPTEKNTAEYINDVLIPTITNSGFHPIAGEVRWCKNTKNQNVVRYFGATEGRTTLKTVIEKIETL